MAQEFRIFGPPGTGKTTALAASVRKRVNESGPSGIVAASFTRAAAVEIAGRDLGLDRANIGTLHALAYRALGRPDVAEEQIEDFNARHPEFALSTGYRPTVEEMAPADAFSTTQTDDVMNQVETLRARRMPVEGWPTPARTFYAVWSAWKADAGVLDFTDLIDGALTQTETAPGNPHAGYFDECFPAGVLVLAARGLVPIEDIVVGDLVLTHRERWRMVTATTHRRAVETVIVHSGVHPGLRCTPEHPLRCNDRWVAAKESTAQDLTVPRHFEPSRVPEIGVHPPTHGRAEAAPWNTDSAAFAWIVGRYLADGSLAHSQGTKAPAGALNRTWMSIGAPKAAEFATWVAAAGMHATRNREVSGCVNFVINSAPLARWFDEHCGRGAATKRFPTWLLGLSEGQRQAALEGYLAGDGCYVVTNSGATVRKAATASWSLAVGLRLLGASLGIDFATYDGGSAGGWQLVTRTGGLHRRVRSVYGAPGCEVFNLSVADDESYVADGIVVHNCQDFTPLELALVRHWGASMDDLIMVGDDDQCLYTFKGSTPEAFLDPPVPDDHKWILNQSYRLPRAVHAVANNWIKRVSRREPKEFAPRDAEGKVRVELAYNLAQVDELVSDIETQISGGDTAMVLGSCAYMLSALKTEMKARGLPFHNPYRRSRADWNPLHPPGKGVAAKDRLLAYLILDERIFGEAAHGWTGEDVRRWSALIKKAGVFRRGAAQLITGLPADRELTFAEVASLFDNEQVLEEAVEPSLGWFRAHMLGSQAERMAYPIEIALRRGPPALREAARVVIGTVHSAKGGEADHVYLLPDLSRASGIEWQMNGVFRDPIVRMMYVGMTRAKEELIFCGAASPRAVPVIGNLGMRPAVLR